MAKISYFPRMGGASMSWTHVQEDWRGVRNLLLRGGDASEWQRDALRSALAQDAHDVANDAELLAAILRGRAAEAAESGDRVPDLDAVTRSVRTRRPSGLRSALSCRRLSS